jgi:hypothetical protein
VLSIVALTLTSHRFWNRKIKIALLAALTFAALC